MARVQNPEAAQQLQAHYTTYQAHGLGMRGAPWTQEAALHLGRLFVSAYGILPPGNHLRSVYGMPEYNTIKRLFGSVAAYQAQVRQVAEGGNHGGPVPPQP